MLLSRNVVTYFGTQWNQPPRYHLFSQVRKLGNCSEKNQEIFGIRTINSEIYPEPPFSHSKGEYREGTRTTSFPVNK